MKVVPTLLRLALLPTLAPGLALACSCAPQPPPVQALEQASEVFRGTVLAIEDSAASGSSFYRGIDFQVSEVWKGEGLGLLRTHTPNNSAACGRGFQVGIEYLVYTDADGTVTLCSRTTPVASAQQDLAALGAGSPPAPAELGALARHAVVAGAWHRPDAPGEGLLVEMIDVDRAALYWYGYTPGASQGSAPGQRWLFGVGRFDGNQLVVDPLLEPEGEGFAAQYDPSTARLPEVGVARLRFLGNGRAVLRYTLERPGVFPQQGELSLQRINRPPVPGTGLP